MAIAGTFTVTQAVTGFAIPAALQFERMQGVMVPKSLMDSDVNTPGIDGADIKWQSKQPVEFAIMAEFVLGSVAAMNTRTALFETCKGRIGTLTMPGSQSLALVALSGKSSYGPLRQARGAGIGGSGVLFCRDVNLIFRQVG